MASYMLVRHRVRDFSVWKPGYDAHLPKRAEAGLTEVHLLRGAHDAGEIVILFRVADLSRAKAFAGNNVGAGWAEWIGVKNWVVGGDTDADSNVLIGPRVGIHFDYAGAAGSSSNITVRRNYSDHLYYGGWSQGNNLEGGANASLLAEHNILIGSSWTIRGMAPSRNTSAGGGNSSPSRP